MTAIQELRAGRPALNEIALQAARWAVCQHRSTVEEASRGAAESSPVLIAVAVEPAACAALEALEELGVTADAAEYARKALGPDVDSYGAQVRDIINEALVRIANEIADEACEAREVDLAAQVGAEVRFDPSAREIQG